MYFKQRDNRLVRPGCYALAMTVVQAPQALAECLAYSLPVYWMSGLDPAASRYLTFLLVIFSSSTSACAAWPPARAGAWEAPMGRGGRWARMPALAPRAACCPGPAPRPHAGFGAACRLVAYCVPSMVIGHATGAAVRWVGPDRGGAVAHAAGSAPASDPTPEQLFAHPWPGAAAAPAVQHKRLLAFSDGDS